MALTQLALVVASFLIGYIPDFIFRLWRMISSGEELRFFTLFDLSTYALKRFADFLNPILYNIGSSEIRNSTKQLFKDAKKLLRLRKSYATSDQVPFDDCSHQVVAIAKV